MKLMLYWWRSRSYSEAFKLVCLVSATLILSYIASLVQALISPVAFINLLPFKVEYVHQRWFIHLHFLKRVLLHPTIAVTVLFPSEDYVPLVICGSGMFSSPSIPFNIAHVLLSIIAPTLKILAVISLDLLLNVGISSSEMFVPSCFKYPAAGMAFLGYCFYENPWQYWKLVCQLINLQNLKHLGWYFQWREWETHLD